MEKFKQPEFIEKLKRMPDLAFREIVKELFPWFRSFVRKTYPTLIADVEDIIQDTAVKITENVDTLDPQKGNFLSWSFRILRNCCIDTIKRHQKMRMVSLEEETAGMIDLEPSDPESPEDFVTIIEQLAPESGMREAFLRLRPRECLIIGMTCAGWSDEEIVNKLNITSKGALWVGRSRALANLKEEYEKINRPK